MLITFLMQIYNANGYLSSYQSFKEKNTNPHYNQQDFASYT